MHVQLLRQSGGGAGPRVLACFKGGHVVHAHLVGELGGGGGRAAPAEDEGCVRRVFERGEVAVLGAL